MSKEELIKKIQKSQADGKSKETVYKDLLAQGEKVDGINAAYADLYAAHEKEDTNRRTINIIVYLGALLIGVGVFSFIASNWDVMAKSSKVLVIVFFMIVAYAAGWFLKEGRGLVKTGEALYFLGSIIYGAGIFLVAQIFNIHANWTDGFLLWMFGTLAMGFAISSWPLLYLSVGLGLISTFGTPFTLVDAVFGLNTQRVSTLVLILAVIVTFISGYVVRRTLPEEVKR